MFTAANVSSRMGTCVAALLLAACAGCGDQPAAASRDELAVFVSIPPQVYFAERIGGDLVRAESLVGPGANPHTFTPTPRQMTRMAQADLFLAIGVEFEVALLDKIRSAYPNLKVIPCQAGVPPREGADEPNPHADADAEAHDTHDDHDHDHDHGHDEPHGGHAHGSDTHIWLDPLRAKRIANNVCAALQSARPEHSARFAANLAALLLELDATHADLARRLEPYRDRSVFVYHPAYGYFLDRYGLRQVAVEVQGRSPTASELAALIKAMGAAGAEVLYFDPRFDRSNAEQIASQLDLRIAPLDPLAADYLANLRRIADALLRGWSKPS